MPEKEMKEGMTEERKRKIYELEKKLGRHDESKKKQMEENHKLLKYFVIAANMMYTLVGPLVLMMGLYFFLKKYLFNEDKPVVLIIFLFIGAFTGYWSLIKQITNIK